MKAATLIDLLDVFPKAQVMLEGSDIEVVFATDENGAATFNIIKRPPELELNSGQM